MRHAKAAGALVSALALFACAADPLPDAAIVTTVARPKPPALLHVDGVTIEPKPGDSKTDESRPWGDDVAWRAQGAGAIAYGTNDGVLFVTAAHGVEGFFRTAASLGALRWGGFGKNDAVLLVVGTKLVRAASIADALGGKFVELPSAIDPAVDRFASAGDVFVAGSNAGAYFESTDGGKTLKRAALPAKLPLAQLVVRDDGLVLAALETARKPGKYGGTTIHAQTWTKARRSAAWKKSALVEGHEPSLVDLSGAVVEAIRITNDADFDTGTGAAVALDAKGTWIGSGFTPPWMQLWPSPSFEPMPPPLRPTMPTTGAQQEDADLLAGGLMSIDCTGVACLSHREYLSPAPHAYVLDDAICDASAVIDRPEEVEDADGFRGKHTIHRNVCDEKKPAARTATLVVPGAGLPKTYRLPSWCPSGSLTGSDLFPLLQCDMRYGGKGVLVSFDDSGTFTEAGTLPNEAGWRRRVERSADGTTVVTTEGAFALCDPKARLCTAIGKDGSLLAARPLDGGRAIVASAPGPTLRDLRLSLVDHGVSRTLVDVHVDGNVVDFGVTANGNVRLSTHRPWKSAPLRPGAGKADRAWLVRVDGSLVPEESP